MKCFKLCLVVVALMSGMAQAALVHQWVFNGNYSDSVGGVTATPVGNADVTTQFGVVKLDGVDDWVDLGGPAINIAQYTDGFTLKLWSTQPTTDQGYSMTAAFGGTWDNGWAGKKYVAISTTRGDQVSRAMLTTGNNSGAPWTEEVGVNGPELNDGKLHLYALTVGYNSYYNTNMITYYIDGVIVGAMNIGNRLISDIATDKAFLGAGMYPGDPEVLCDIEEFSIYNRALSPIEIYQNWAAGPVPVPEPATMVLLGLGSLALVRRRRS